MSWILIAYLFVLLYVSVHRAKFPRHRSFRAAWIAFALIPISHFVFVLFRAGNFGDTRDMALVEIWADGVVWLLLGISLIYLTGTVAPDRAEDTGPSNSGNLPPPPP